MVSIIIVGWNCASHIGACLASLRKHPPSAPFEVIYVDNASTDGSVEHVRRDDPAVRVLVNSRNEGFQRGNNRGLAEARGDLLILLNPDTEVLRGSLDTLCGFLRDRGDVGAVSPRCVYPDGRLQWAVAPFPSLAIIKHWFRVTHPKIGRLLGAAASPQFPDHEPRTQEQAYAYGACFATRREVVDAIGPMDEGFFLTGGEVAWSREIQRAGWKVYYVAEAVIVHRESVSRGRRSWISELDWVSAHRRLLYLYEGVRAGIIGDLIFSTHLALWIVGRILRSIGHAVGLPRPARRSPA